MSQTTITDFDVILGESVLLEDVDEGFVEKDETERKRSRVEQENESNYKKPKINSHMLDTEKEDSIPVERKLEPREDLVPTDVIRNSWYDGKGYGRRHESNSSETGMNRFPYSGQRQFSNEKKHKHPQILRKKRLEDREQNVQMFERNLGLREKDLLQREKNLSDARQRLRQDEREFDRTREQFRKEKREFEDAARKEKSELTSLYEKIRSYFADIQILLHDTVLTKERRK